MHLLRGSSVVGEARETMINFLEHQGVTRGPLEGKWISGQVHGAARAEAGLEKPAGEGRTLSLQEGTAGHTPSSLGPP